jgi:ADP-ribose pyrophosphatase YjhB (NUDIX family)
MSGQRAHHIQYAALPFRQRADATIEIMLITSRNTGRWLIPKGWPEPGLAPPETAAQEAREEGGLVGRIADGSIGSYHYDKRLPDGSTMHCVVEVFALNVTRQMKSCRSGMNGPPGGLPCRTLSRRCGSRNYARLFGTFKIAWGDDVAASSSIPATALRPETPPTLLALAEKVIEWRS